MAGADQYLGKMRHIYIQRSQHLSFLETKPSHDGIDWVLSKPDMSLVPTAAQ